ncbi:MAG: TrmB family transcriptional regulator [Promethearchaeota archaeon]
MSQKLTHELEEFLRNSNLSTYEIRAYLTLLKSSILTARSISEKCSVPTGRIYEVLESLNKKGMIEIQDSRPKIYKAITFNTAADNLITHIKNDEQRKITFLINQAKELESKINNSESFATQPSSKIFWSTAYGWRSIFDLYIKKFNTLKENLFMTGFLNENTLKVIPQAKIFYIGILNALNRGIHVKYLWCFEFDERTLSNEQKSFNESLFEKLTETLENLFRLSPKINGFEMGFIHKKIPTYFDIFDNNRVLIKLQNPLKPWQIFACLNILDPFLANELTKKYENIWLFEAIKGKI